MLAYILIFGSVSLNLVCGSVSESDSTQNNTSSFTAAPINLSSSSGFSDNLYPDGSGSSNPVSSPSALQIPVIPHNIYSSGMAPVHQTATNALVTDNVSSSKSSSPVADNIFTSTPVFNHGITVFGANYPCYGNILTPLATDYIGNGPETGPLPVLQAPPLTLPCLEEPIITLCNPPVLRPRVISSKCICSKTVVKPQIYERTVTVPKIERYLTRTVNPIVENVAFKSKPITTCQCAACANRNKATVVATLIGSTLPIYASRSMSPCVRVS